MKQILRFEVDEIKLIQDISDSQLAIAEVKVCHDGMNLHEKPIDIDAMKKASTTLINKWLVAGFDGWDFKGHEGKAQLIIGFFPKENDFRYVEENGKTYFVANAIFSKIYAQWAYDVFKKENLKECSMEITVLDTEKREDGYEWITSYVYNAVTVLGHNNSAACPGSDVQIIKFSTDKIQEYEKIYREHINFQIPQIVKQNAQKGLILKNQNPKGVTAVNLSIAQQLISNDYASLELINNIYKFSQKAKTETARYLLGNVEAFEWIDNILNSEIQEQFSEEGGKNVLPDLTYNQIRDRLRSCFRDFKYSEGMYIYERYYVDDFKDSVVYVLDYEDSKYYQFNFIFKDEACQVDLNSKSQVEETYKPATFAQKVEFSVGDKLGKSSAIDIKNKKDDAIMSGSWSDPGAIALNKMLEASNHESCVNEFYLIIDGNSNGDLSINNVHYPHHTLQGEEMVVNRQGVISAYDRLMAQHVTGEALTHIQKHRKELELDANDNKEGDKVAKKEKMAEFCNSQKFTKDEQEVNKYSYMSHDDNFMYALDKEFSALMAIPYSVETENDEENYSVDFSNAKKAKMSIGMSEEEDFEDDVYMSLKNEFTSDENTLATAQEALNQKEAEYNEMLTNMDDMKQQMEDIKSQMEQMSAENQQLKDEKMARLEQEKMATVEYSLQEVSEVLPKEKMEELREDSKNFSIDNINAWVNKVKAEAFSFSKGNTNNDDFTKIGTPWANVGKSKNATNSVWDRI